MQGQDGFKGQTMDKSACYAPIRRAAGTVWHMDVYRLNGDEDMAQLDISTLIAQHLCIIEWPERLGQHTPRPCIHCAIDFPPSKGSSPVLMGRTYTLVVHP